MKLEIFFKHQEWAAQTACYFILTDNDGKRLICKPMNMEFEPLKDGISQEPSLNFTHQMGMQFFPALVDGLARIGYKYESSDAGELKATKVHLSDMRDLVFKRGPL